MTRRHKFYDKIRLQSTNSSIQLPSQYHLQLLKYVKHFLELTCVSPYALSRMKFISCATLSLLLALLPISIAAPNPEPNPDIKIIISSNSGQLQVSDSDGISTNCWAFYGAPCSDYEQCCEPFVCRRFTVSDLC